MSVMYVNLLLIFQQLRGNKAVMHLTRSPEGKEKSHTHTKSIPKVFPVTRLSQEDSSGRKKVRGHRHARQRRSQTSLNQTNEPGSQNSEEYLDKSGR